jgi:hypothetical protein
MHSSSSPAWTRQTRKRPRVAARSRQWSEARNWRCLPAFVATQQATLIVGAHVPGWETTDEVRLRSGQVSVQDGRG